MGVHIKPALTWNCPCGHVNYEQATLVDMDESTEDEIDEQGMHWLEAIDDSPGEIDEDGTIVPMSQFLRQAVALAPKRVKCAECGDWHDTEFEDTGEDIGEI